MMAFISDFMKKAAAERVALEEDGLCSKCRRPLSRSRDGAYGYCPLHEKVFKGINDG